MTDTTPTQRVAELIKDFRFAMFTTRNAQDRLVAHPLTVQEAEFDGDLWFLVSRSASFLEDLRRDDHAGVSLSSNGSWVSLSGTAELVEDPAKVRELWSPTVEAWFTEGPDDPDVGLLKFSAESAEYWDSPGGKLASLFSFVKAKVTGEPYDAENEKVELPDA
ncbi:pyridoxamine 5'-phosphate oxidase family protein [Microbacterium saperdae]|uniref:General stress protein 26 n=1 Tax=Microbacterium saperdae TaxID=69368 RepID=A0A543BME6_9MICO|nr:pyridoxamine 5'-phosphate oxidase family protein [Microbacterium saperdae]TQL85986.1 general stress protein 26 [Microbacterium saperdae]GGM51503.1 general stress protein [Microbacterium saperdae]